MKRARSPPGRVAPPSTGTRPLVRPLPARQSHDPELDRPGGLPPIRPDPDFGRYQRLVANPFLALLALIPWFLAMRQALLTKNLMLTLALFFMLSGVACLLQYHCLDCGATGVLFRWRRHVCEPALARQLAGRPGRFRGPNPTTQTVLWVYCLTIAAVVLGILLRAAQ